MNPNLILRMPDDGNRSEERKIEILDMITQRDEHVDEELFWISRTPSGSRCTEAILRLWWAVLMDWIWCFMEHRCNLDHPEDMRVLVRLFPRLPEDLPERLIRRRDELRAANQPHLSYRQYQARPRGPLKMGLGPLLEVVE